MTQQAKENYKPTTLINIVVMCSEKYWEPKLNSTLKDLMESMPGYSNYLIYVN